MSSFSCPIVRVHSVTNHPNADRLSIIALDGLGYTAISAKLDSGESRYKTNDWVVYIPSGAVLPMFLLKTMGFWDEVAGKGTLAGSNGDRVKPLKLRGIFSEGLLFPVRDRNGSLYITNGEGDSVKVFAGEDVSRYLDIVKYEPPIPVHMAGEVANLSDHTVRYDFERYESVPDIFSKTDTVVATEKLHGCLHSDALVMLPNGEEVTISEIVSGHYSHVMSYDTERKEYVTRKITGRMRRPNLEAKKWVKLTMENGRTLTLTSDHPVYSRDRQVWIDAGKIKADEDIESPIM